MSVTPAIVVQGGAAAYVLVEQDKIAKSAVEDGVVTAATAGYRILVGGGSAVDAVQAAVACMEDDPVFNCGYGSFLTCEHTIEMDASIMDGAGLSTGAVACITNVKNPILVARAVMDKTPHTMFCGDSAKKLATSFGIETVSTESLTTEKALNRFLPFQDCAAVRRRDRDPDDHDTVGAVAVDCHGNVAYATSTGGISGKMCGRVGDSPIVGSGGYADNHSGAVSTTGDGEAFVKMCTAKHVSLLMEQGHDPQSAVEMTLTLLSTRLPGSDGGGCVAVNGRGDTGVYFNTKGMAWTIIKENHIQYGMYKDELKTKVYSG